ncbi:HD-GYP domain-containing protein (c-di-GMP phosphodiesterase class II) [Caldanaerobacter subterraneus subsp. tengcongensis MB4]|uniref:HD-GYP domain-containing protein n=1 Tax=Caldanaerobacter subterraneus subsp. tengcongensis (strain DSM 15242 / JCM 11007 / NBRC 100824 / MB4) TaxID=273068 RepID=Q8RCI1_CALS4|nr:hypothetical protein [Caldanaerobacter sp.]AAM23731.1 hypothetical protein TTE0447 [Caldanaerobacter subterraneus subsp. tengcongensis MB4]MCS3916774.1 HD-GYP domain-containing protein (c-di-GMP phosphodiesterase class II) [Caldanaerobacter subterraneus subsp. tengcongensis MB4]
MSAHIIGICDSFDAMTTKRPYNQKRLKSMHEAMLELKTMPYKYNYKIVEALEEVVREIKGDQRYFISQYREGN